MTTTDTEAFSDIFYNDTAKKYPDADPVPAPLEKPPFPLVTRHRVFLNQVDTFHSKHIASFLADQIYGALAAAEGGAGEGEEEEDQQSKVPLNLTDKYEIIGTLKAPFHKKSEDILYTIQEGDENFMEEILQCGAVIYNIGQDDGEIPKALSTLGDMVDGIEKIKDIGPKTFQNYNELRIFILLSTVMTWGATKPIDPEEPDTPFNESDYKKRRPHPNYKEHIACEKEVVLQGRKFKDKLRTYVVCCGIAYGEDEDDFTFYFKLAWNNEDHLPVFMPGKNFIPLIHIQDLSRVIHGIIETTPKKPQFILAVEQTPCTLKQIVKALSKAMGRGKIKEIAKEDAFLYADITQSMFERYTVNLNMEPAFIAEDLELEWKNEMNLAENMSAIVTEFRKARNLKPMKLVIHGPPGVGKTTLANKICALYGTQHLTVKSVIEDTLMELREKIEEEKEKQRKKAEDEAKQAAAPAGDEDEQGEEEQEEEEDEEADLEELQEQLRDIEGAIAANERGKLPDEDVIRLVRKQLMSNRCANQGYVLDGFPKTMEQTKALFGAGGGGGEGEEEEPGEEEDEEGEEGAAPKSTILPDYVITLYGTDEFLCNRIMELPEKDIQGTHYTEENMLRRLNTYHANNTEDNTLLNFFDEREIHPIVIDVMKRPQPTDDYDVQDIFRQTVEKLGPPIKFAPTLQEEAKMNECLEESRKLDNEAKKLEQELFEKKELVDYQNKMEAWLSSLEKVQLEEEKLIIAQSEPLRNYLIKFVFPTLTKGLIEVARVKPYDPVDYLAEFLFKENPEGHMFDPSYTKEGEALEVVRSASQVATRNSNG